MNKNHVISLLLLAFLLVGYSATWAQSPSISIEYSSGNLVVPVDSSTTNITWHVRATNLESGATYAYRWQWSENPLSNYQTLGSGPGPLEDYFSTSDLLAGVYFMQGYLYKYVSGNWQQVAGCGPTFYIDKQYRIYVENSYHGNSVIVDGGAPCPSGTPFIWTTRTSHTLTATDNVPYDNVYRRFDYWSGTGLSGSGSTVTATITWGNSSTYTAHFHGEYHVILQNYFPGHGNGGTIEVSHVPCSSPSGVQVVTEENSIRGDVYETSKTIGGIDYQFSNWTPGGYTETGRDFFPTSNTTYTANFSAKPHALSNLQQIASVNQNVHLTWDNNSDEAVNIVNIYRHEAGPNPRVLVGSVGRTGGWTDPDIIVKAPKDGPEYVYDVCCTLSGASESDFVTVDQFGQPVGARAGAQLAAEDGAALPTHFSVGNYPNPFNPTTTIAYSLVQNSALKLDIYDVMGRKVRSLVDGNKSAGYYSVVWNGRDESGKQVASGMYLYRFTASPVTGEKAFTQSGKLMLTK